MAFIRPCAWLNGICPKPGDNKSLLNDEVHWLCDEHYEYIGTDTEEEL